MSDSKVTLELSREEAIVLFEWICRFNAENNAFEDQAEQRVLWDIESTLESTLEEALDPRYDELLAAARSKVRDRQE